MAHGGLQTHTPVVATYSLVSMTGLQPNDPSLARFRRGEGRRVGPPGPPPAVQAYSGPPADDAAVATTVSWAPEAQPITVADLPAPTGTQSPEFSVPPPAPTPFGELLGPADAPWLPVDDDPGRTSGIVSIVVGFFAGLVGVFIGIASIRASRRAGLAGAIGTAGIVVSVLNILVGGAVGVSYVRYQVTLAQQCALVGPGQFATQTGDQVTCR